MVENRNKQTQDSIVYVESESDDNKYTAELMLVFLFMFYILFMMNEFEIFLVEKFVMRVAFITNFVCVAIITIIGGVPAISSKKITKYIILGLCVIFTLVIMSALNFHAVIALSVPMVVALNYHSRRLSYLALMGTIFCAFLSPVLGIMFNTWQPDYFGTLLFASDPMLDFGTLKKYVPVLISEMKPYEIALIYISIPQVFYAIMLGIAIIITNKRKRKQYYGQIDNIKESRNRILEAIAGIIENKDFTTNGHVKRTEEVVKLMLSVLKQDPLYKDIITEEYCDNVATATLMHDLGKIAVPDSILDKKEELTPEELEKFKIHPRKSYEHIEVLLAGLNDEEFKQIAENMALYHHERYDGTGYPEGLSGDRIPLEARIMAVADGYDELVSDEYGEAVSHEKAYEIVRESMGARFDPGLWSAFAKAHRKIVEYYHNSQ